jgi:hypothetical protein
MSYIPFELKSIDLVADWNYCCLNTDCSICDITLYESPDIRNKGNNCNVFRYECQHAFHQKCIKKWLKTHIKTQNYCPICNCNNFKFDTTLNMQSNIKLFKK